MNQPKYQLKAGDNLTTYEFLSEGSKGKIVKLIQFTTTNYHDVFNLAFGDKDGETGQIDDKVISNNGDSEMVLATVVSALYAFTDKHPDAWIYATGSTKSRTRLYRMGITKYLKEVKTDFQIFGQVGKAWEEFEKEVDYESFLVRRKNQ
ncbi:MAG: hypothetical protein NTX03_08010 [Bacteroidetes bacterium]|nr:hypothetical protein [Bacteroidota bacterium]